MTKEPIIEKSFIEQTVDDMFEIIEAQDEFDAQTIENLKKLAIAGKLSSKTQVIASIKSVSREHHEND